jgi:hypothetical protein
MSKSHECGGERELALGQLSKVYRAIFSDAKYAYPDIEEAFCKDEARLLRCIEKAGIRVLLVDLPALGKHLDRCLSQGAYRCTGLCLGGKCPGHVQLPSFLKELYLRVFDASGSLKGDYDVQAIFFLRQILYGAKKTRLQCSQEAIDDEVEAFLEVDIALPEPDSFWSQEAPHGAEIVEVYRGFSASPLYSAKVQGLPAEKRADATRFLRALDFVSGAMTTTLGPYSYGEWEFRHGPGAISVKPASGNKYSWLNWSPRLESVFPIADCGFHNWLAWIDHIVSGDRIGYTNPGSPLNSMMEDDAATFGETEPSSRLIDVPKTLLKPRLIAAEPCEHQWCQQNMWHYFRTRVRDTWVGNFVRFTDQSLNQELCRKGSEDGTLSTTDLSSASDRVTCHAVGQLFRGNLGLLQALRGARTRFVDVELAECRFTVPLKKFSTMGSACTFPVESLMFLCITLAAVLATRRTKLSVHAIEQLKGEVAVFGDDIVSPVDSRELLEWGLEALDFRINRDKTFWEGSFRESCGVDCYAGIDVTPAYYQGPLYESRPETIAAAVEVSNNFYRRFMVRTANAVASTLPRRTKTKGVALLPMVSGCVGLKSFVAPQPGARYGGSHLRKRVNRHHQTTMFEAFGMSADCPKTQIDDPTAFLQYCTERPRPDTKWCSGVTQRPQPKERLIALGVEAWSSSRP